MKILYENGIALPSLRSGQSMRNQNLMDHLNGTKKTASSFDFLLTHVIETIREKSNLSSENSPLHNERLRQLVEMIRIEMDSSLFNAVADSEEDEVLLRSHENRTRLPERVHELDLCMSRIRHPTEREDSGQQQWNVERIVERASKTYGVDPDLIKAVIQAESDFDPNCTSSKGAMGLMQLMPETAKELGVQDAYSPVENIMGGTRYLRSLLDRYDGNVPLALAAYNWGMGNVERHPGKLPQETRTYISRVNRYYQAAVS